jgi:hypothetical protein
MGKGNQVTTYLIVMSSLLISCFSPQKKKQFYCDTKADFGVWRLPIIEPFEFVSTNGTGGWTLSWPSSMKQNYLFNFSADSINYKQGLIFCFANSGLFNLNIIDIENKKVIRLNNRTEFNSFMRDRQLSNKLYSINSVFEKWRLTKELPWRQEISPMPSCY